MTTRVFVGNITACRRDSFAEKVRCCVCFRLSVLRTMNVNTRTRIVYALTRHSDAFNAFVARCLIKSVRSILVLYDLRVEKASIDVRIVHSLNNDRLLPPWYVTPQITIGCAEWFAHNESTSNDSRTRYDRND
jgi:hypothetical protein